MLGIASSLIGDVWSRNPENLHMELSFLASVDSTDLETPGKIVGAREIDMSVLPDGTRRVYFVATLQSGQEGCVANLQLWDVTHGVMVTSASLSNSGAPYKTIADTFVSAQLTEGNANGNIRIDAPAEYEIRLYRSGGVAGDTVSCLNAYLRIIFE